MSWLNGKSVGFWDLEEKGGKTVKIMTQTHTGTNQSLVIIPTNCLTFPHLGLFSHTLLFSLSFVPTDDQVASHAIVLAPVLAPIILMALIFVLTQPTLIYFVIGQYLPVMVHLAYLSPALMWFVRSALPLLVPLYSGSVLPALSFNFVNSGLFPTHHSGLSPFVPPKAHLPALVSPFLGPLLSLPGPPTPSYSIIQEWQQFALSKYLRHLSSNTDHTGDGLDWSPGD